MGQLRRTNKVSIAALKRKGYSSRKRQIKALVKRLADATEKTAVAAFLFGLLQEINTVKAFVIGAVAIGVSMFLTWRVGK